MKKSFLKLAVIFSIVLAIVSCDNDESTSTRSADKIEILIDNTTLLSYSTNIIATEYPLPSTSGFNCSFRITSEDLMANTFSLDFLPSVVICPYTINTPTTINLIGSQLSLLNIQGLDIDTSHSSNSITINYQVFGANIGDSIKITLSGSYYDSLGSSHAINGEIDITKN